jgi:hypothetical protein
MLLSIPTWIIHLLTVSEWLTAILLIRRYAAAIAHPRLPLFALAMIPHLIGGLLVLAFHLSGDQTRWLIGGSRLFTFAGAVSLLAVTLWLLQPRRMGGAWPAVAVLAAGVLWGGWRLFTADGPASLLPGTNLAYLTFLVTLLLLHRKDRSLFSPISVFGFWFLLVFVAVTIIATGVATQQLGLPSLTHADLLHGASESLLSVSNFLIAFGAYRRLRMTTAGGWSAALPGSAA